VAGLRERCSEVIDLREHFAGPRADYYWSDLHLNLAGQALVAELLGPRLEALRAAR